MGGGGQKDFRKSVCVCVRSRLEVQMGHIFRGCPRQANTVVINNSKKKKNSLIRKAKINETKKTMENPRKKYPALYK